MSNLYSFSASDNYLDVQLLDLHEVDNIIFIFYFHWHKLLLKQ